MTAVKGISGAHAILYSKDAAADRAFLRDVLGLPFVDAHDGWLIFGLPPSEVAVHPHDANDHHEFYLICEDVRAFTTEMKRRGVEHGPLLEQPWGVLTQVTLPGGGKLGVYEARHARPKSMPAAKGKPSAKSRPAKRAAKPKAAKKPAKRKAAAKKPKAKRRAKARAR